jgi:FkbM family methyltransferase
LEDVMICRALGTVNRGCFVDVGASYPVEDNNTYALYERGWRGIAIDPQPHLTEPWRTARPEDIFLSVAVGTSEGEAELYLTPKWTQMATMRPDYAKFYRENREDVVATRVRTLPLSTVLRAHLGGREVHVMSVDVEGSEAAVLASLDLGRYRPWLIVIEATRPGMPVPVFQEWESTLLGAQYNFAYFDGLNRFYVARERSELRGFFTTPPNVWDDFVNYRTVWLERMLATERSRSESLAKELSIFRSK